MTDSSRALARSFLIVLLLVFVVNSVLIAPFFLTLFLGWMLAEILRPVHVRLLEKKMHKAWASFFSTIVIALVFNRLSCGTVV